MLEKISNKLDIPMSFWFEIPGKTIIPSSTNKDGIMYEKIIQDYLDDKRRMKMEIDELKEKLEKYEGKKKEAI
ncbi:MAG: hypothetical protein NTU51_10420 [Bacteroidetes bacterium]|nr:hypothetical protein [Bacteroidota bacterium]